LPTLAGVDMTNRFKDTLVQTHPSQDHNDQLDGTKGRGLWVLHTAMSWLGVFGHSSLPVDWFVEVELPNPGGGTPIVYRWLTITADNDIIDGPGIPLPKGTKIKVRTSLVNNSMPKAQIVTKLLVDEA